MISEVFYKDRPAIKIHEEGFEALFLPEDGAKFASFKTKNGQELFAVAPQEKYKRLFIDSSYIDSECSAFDDMFPTIDPCMINGMDYIDHGEVCRREHSCKIENDSVKFECTLPKLNITYKKTVFVEDGTLCIKYGIENHNKFDFPYIWAGHMMFKGEEDAQVVSDFSDDNIRVMFGNPPTDDKISKLQKYGSNNQYKYYYTEQKIPMKCGIVYPKSNLRVSLEFIGDSVKYLGVWMNPGDLNEMYNVALEPCTALFDDPINAQKAGAESVIKPEEAVEFTLKIRCEEK